MTLPTPIIHDVMLRDGLQQERQVVDTDDKLAWFDQLRAAGIDIIQVGSFVHPKKVPQMADTDELCRRIRQRPDGGRGTVIAGLVLNERGLERALAADVDLVCMGVSASETHSRKNTGMTVAEATDRIAAMAVEAARAGKQVQASVQSAFGCGFEGPVPDRAVLAIVERFAEVGVAQLSLADTAGHATPADVERLFGKAFELGAGAEWACHLHDTYGAGMANAYAALKVGVTVFEAATAGLGGCPFTKVAGGNLCTEDWVHLLHRLELRRELELEPLLELGRAMAATLGHELHGRVRQAGPIATATRS